MRKIWALADTHLPFGNPRKSMEVFGPRWKDYPERIRENCNRLIGPDDLLLIPGDISWAMKPEEALADLDFIDALPGEKLIIRGNHDYWWPSNRKLQALLPPSVHFVHNTAFNWNGVTFGGARLWDTREYQFDQFIEFVKNPLQSDKAPPNEAETERIFLKELERLRLSLQQMDPKASTRIALTHYPPIGADLKPSRAAAVLEDFQVSICVFGHLHNVPEGTLPFGTARGVRYLLTSSDYLGFTPIEIKAVD